MPKVSIISETACLEFFRLYGAEPIPNWLVDVLPNIPDNSEIVVDKELEGSILPFSLALLRNVPYGYYDCAN